MVVKISGYEEQFQGRQNRNSRQTHTMQNKKLMLGFGKDS